MRSRREAAVDDDNDVLKPIAEDELSMDHGGTHSNSSINNGLDGSITCLDSSRASACASASNIGSNSSTMRLRIKSSYEDLEIQIPEKGSAHNTSVARIKALVKIALAKKLKETETEGSRGSRVQDRNLRLICKGRLLSPDESFLSEFKIASDDVVHAVLGPPAVVRKGTKQGQKNRSGNREREQTQTTGTFQNLPQHQRRRRQRPNRGIGTIVGPGGRVTRAPGGRNSGGEDSNSSDDENDIERGITRERRGFNRLRGAGLSRQEITAIRTYFNRHVDRYVQQQQQEQQAGTGSDAGDTNTNENATANANLPSTLHLDEPDLRRRRLLVEEEWMSTQGAASEFRLNLNQNTLLRFASLSSNGMSISGANTRGVTSASTSGPRERPGSDRDFLWGFCLGFFVGVISLVWVWMPTIPHKQKLGILAGICFQLILEANNKDFEENGMGDISTYGDGN